MLTLLAAGPIYAQQTKEDVERDRVFTEIRAYKHDVLVKSLDLTKEQQREFFPVYDELDDKLMEINNETRDLERLYTRRKNVRERWRWSTTISSRVFLLLVSSWG